ncbi:MAG: hypothetical protein IJN50_05295 [Clostridia bacterium]|nr:hypothetical protein [Clostridia bacterium]
MQNCLGIYIENNVIKYAKVAKERDDLKIESYGIKFYDNIEETIKQIIEETYSYKIPICTNLSDEQYTYIDMFNLLNKKDLAKATDTEFELFCNDNGKNKAAIEYRTLQVPNLMDSDKVTTIYTYVNKSSVVGRLKDLNGGNVASIVPISLAIPLLNNFADGKNSVIINIENKTTVTTIVNGSTYKIDVIDNGMEKILSDIAAKENSNQKAYEICKNATIYTLEASSLQVAENEYMPYIMPTLYSIIEEVKEVLAKNQIEVSNIYITGLATAINNLDLYFQENFVDKKCEILTPFFVETTNIKLNVKDYIEVNSAIALALNNLLATNKTVDFKGESFKSKLTNKVSSKPQKENKNGKIQNKKTKSNLIKMDLGTSLDFIETILVRVLVGILLLVISYSIAAKYIVSRIEDKKDEMQIVIDDTQKKIKDISGDITKVNSKTTEYEERILKIEEAKSERNEYYKTKNAIPLLLTRIRTVIPDGVQLLHIENTTGKHVQIKAQAEKYEQLGFFIAKLKTDAILINITSDSGTKTDNVIQITIEGDFPEY